MRPKRTKTGFHRVGTALAIACTVLASSPATSAQDRGAGKHWLQLCTDGNRVNDGLCTGFIVGIGELNDLPEMPGFYCRPAGVSVGQEKAVVVKYLRENPAKLHMPFIRLVINAFQQAFPCSKNSI